MTEVKLIPHGTRNGYNYYRCRCDECREAQAAYKAARNPRRERPLKHGTHYVYSRVGCRCEECKVGQAVYVKGLRDAKPEQYRELTRRQYAAHREKRKADARRWARENPERVRANTRRYLKENAAAIKVAKLAYYAANAERIKARVAAYKPQWRAGHSAVISMQNRKRRVRKALADTRVFTPKDWRRLQDRYRNCCAYCGAAGVMTLDHVIPLARGGRHAVGNILPACKPCNSSKHSRLLIEWRVRSKEIRDASEIQRPA